MSKKMDPVAQTLVHWYQNTDNPEELVVHIGQFLSGLGRANGMSPETMAQEVSRFLTYTQETK